VAGICLIEMPPGASVLCGLGASRGAALAAGGGLLIRPVVAIRRLRRRAVRHEQSAGTAAPSSQALLSKYPAFENALVTTAKDNLLCRRCGCAVAVSAAHFETFERMHYVCFHYEFEHGEVDPDRECTAGGCPSGALGGGRDTVAATSKRLSEEAGANPAWENDTLAAFL
jgi:hypothetical protein